MKNQMTIREKVMLCILILLLVFAAYYYLFYIPMKEDTEVYKQEYVSLDETLIIAEAKTTKMAKMKAELEAIKQGTTEIIKPLPAYDNRQNLMSQLSNILAKTKNYSITFGGVSGDGTTISRDITLNYSCGSYEEAKGILLEIYNGEYPCVFGTLHLSNEGSTVSIQITYFEYGKVN